MMKYGMYDDRIFKLLELGFSIDEIAEVIDKDTMYVKSRAIKVMVQKRLTKKELNKAQVNKIKLAERRRNKIDKMASFKKDIDVTIIEEHIEYTKANFELGNVKDADVKSMGQAILLDTEFITLSNVQVVVTHYNRQNKPEQTISFLNNCMDMLDYDDNRRIVLDRARGVIDDNVKRRNQNREMLRRMQANASAKTNSIPKHNEIVSNQSNGWEH